MKDAKARRSSYGASGALRASVVQLPGADASAIILLFSPDGRSLHGTMVTRVLFVMYVFVQVF